MYLGKQSYVDGHQDCFLSSAVINPASVLLVLCLLFFILLLLSFGERFLEMEILGKGINAYISLLDVIKFSSIDSCGFCIPTGTYESIPFSPAGLSVVCDANRLNTLLI